MFNNLINVHDLSRILTKAKQGQLNQICLKLISGMLKKVKTSWEHVQNPPIHWWDIPAVRKRWNDLISGDANVDYPEYIARTYLACRESLYGLSLGCGTGERVLRWVGLGKFKRMDAYDLSEVRIEYAINEAKEKGFGDLINYRVADVYGIDVRESFYDVIIAEGALHHFSPLNEILLKIKHFLKPDGYLIVNEFVGPTRFQCTDRQLEVINGLLSILPVKYRITWSNHSIKSNVFRPSRLSMILSDPSEAVESSNILPLLDQLFEVIEVKEYGRTLLQLLFYDIAHHFLSEDEETQRFLRLCFEVEDVLLESNDIQSDFAMVVCKKRIRE